MVYLLDYVLLFLKFRFFLDSGIIMENCSVTHILKSDNPEAMVNYRPMLKKMSMLSKIPKLVESIIHHHITSKNNFNHILNEEQYGFRHRKSFFYDWSFFFLADIIESLESGHLVNVTIIITTDLKRAFDVVIHIVFLLVNR